MKILQKVKEIRSRQGCLHFVRFAIFQTKYLSLYIHRIYRADEDRHFHSHPWNFLTVVLWGAYLAASPKGTSLKHVGSVSWMNREGFHKIEEIVRGPVTTLFLAYGKHQPWYYLMDDGSTLDSNEYRKRKNAVRKWVAGEPLTDEERVFR